MLKAIYMMICESPCKETNDLLCRQFYSFTDLNQKQSFSKCWLVMDHSVP